MPGAWYRPIPPPVQTRVVNNVSEYDSAYTASANGDRIQFNAGTYVMNRIVQKELQFMASGHVQIKGKMRWKADNIFVYGMEGTFPDESSVSPVVLDGSVDAWVAAANNISFINCWVHDFNLDGRNCILNPGGNGGTLYYGSVFHDSRHILYLQNTRLEAPLWIAHCFVGDVETSVDPANAYNFHINSTGASANVQNVKIHENIVANGPNIYAAGDTQGGVSVQFAMHEWKNNFLYRTSIRNSNRPLEIIIDANHFYETLFEWNGGGGSSHIGAQFLHGDNEAALVPLYVHNSIITNNLFHKPSDLNVVNYACRSSRYATIGGREDGLTPWRPPASGDQYDLNSFYGFFRSSMHANGNNQINITSLASHRTITSGQGHQWDTNSTLTAGSPPDYYKIWQNDYDPDRAMIAVWNSDGIGTVPVTLSRAGDIYEIHDQWGTPVYSGGSSYNISPYASQKVWFGIIKYTGGAVPQFLRPTADLNNPGSWTTHLGGSTDLFQQVNETVADDSDYIRSPQAPSSHVTVIDLQNGTDPVSSTGHVFRWRYNKDAAGGGTINLVVELRQGYVNESTLGTLITSQTVNNITDTWTTGVYTLNGTEADTISDYTALSVRFVATQA